MKWDTVYEISSSPFLSADFIFGIAICLIAASSLKESIKKAKNEKKKLHKSFLGYGVLLLCGILLASIVFFPGSSSTAKEYDMGNYEIYEGEISNYQNSMFGKIYFDIGKESFTWTGFMSPIPKEGYVRVFVVDDEIVRIDEPI